jgi:hypothetical protein
MVLKIILKNKKYYFIIFLNKKIFLQNNRYRTFKHFYNLVYKGIRVIWL